MQVAAHIYLTTASMAMAEERRWEGKYCRDQFYKPPDEAEIAKKMVRPCAVLCPICNNIQHHAAGRLFHAPACESSTPVPLSSRKQQTWVETLHAGWQITPFLEQDHTSLNTSACLVCLLCTGFKNSTGHVVFLAEVGNPKLAVLP